MFARSLEFSGCSAARWRIGCAQKSILLDPAWLEVFGSRKQQKKSGSVRSEVWSQRLGCLPLRASCIFLHLLAIELCMGSGMACLCSAWSLWTLELSGTFPGVRPVHMFCQCCRMQSTSYGSNRRGHSPSSLIWQHLEERCRKIGKHLPYIIYVFMYIYIYYIDIHKVLQGAPTCIFGRKLETNRWTTQCNDFDIAVSARLLLTRRGMLCRSCEH